MRLAYTGDLHVDISQKNWNLVPILADFIKIIDPDVLIICGDISPRLEQVEQALEYFADLPCAKLFVPGNHDVWVPDDELRATGRDSFEKYFYLLPRVCHNQGFTPIWMEPAVHDGVGFAGSIGWYDYTFGSGLFRFTEDEYSAKILKDSIFNDRRFARWLDVCSVFEESDRFVSDGEVARQFNQKLGQDINMLCANQSVREVVVVTHHPAFRELVTFKGDPIWDYFTAFMGSSETGKLMLREVKVSHAICGHLHGRTDTFIGHVRALSACVGYLYQDRRKPIQVIEDSIGLVHLLDGREFFDRESLA